MLIVRFNIKTVRVYLMKVARPWPGDGMNNNKEIEPHLRNRFLFWNNVKVLKYLIDPRFLYIYILLLPKLAELQYMIISNFGHKNTSYKICREMRIRIYIIFYLQHITGSKTLRIIFTSYHNPRCFINKITSSEGEKETTVFCRQMANSIQTLDVFILYNTITT